MVMKRETDLGGSDSSFRTTKWTEILAVADSSGPDSREHMERIVRRYWRPVYTYIRAAWRKPVEDAKDLTQSFFARLLEKNYWSKLSPERGSFRGYLKTALKHFLINAKAHEAARKPKKPIFPLDPSGWDEIPVEASSPESAFDREWFRSLIAGAIADLEKTLKGEGKQKYFDVFRLYCFGAKKPPTRTTGLFEDNDNAPTYRETAKLTGVSESDVRNYLTFARRTLRRILRDRIRDYVTTESDVDRELRAAAGG